MNDGGRLRLVEKRMFATVLRREGSLVENVDYGPRGVGWTVR